MGQREEDQLRRVHRQAHEERPMARGSVLDEPRNSRVTHEAGREPHFSSSHSAMAPRAVLAGVPREHMPVENRVTISAGVDFMEHGPMRTQLQSSGALAVRAEFWLVNDSLGQK